jgi:hypothetical protein
VCIFADVTNESGFKYCSHVLSNKKAYTEKYRYTPSNNEVAKLLCLMLMTVRAVRMTVR